MAIPEPANPLYTEVKRIYDAWPPDDEDVARELGEAWRTSAAEATNAASRVDQASANVGGTWMDRAGATLQQLVANHARQGRGKATEMQSHSRAANAYGEQLVAVKKHITDTVEANLAVYQKAGAAGAAGVPIQQQFARQVATYLQRYVEGEAARINQALEAAGRTPKSYAVAAGAAAELESLPVKDHPAARGVGDLVGRGIAGYGTYEDYMNGESEPQAIASNFGALLAGTAGAPLGPAGSVTFGAFVSGAVDSAFEHGPGWENFSDGADNVDVTWDQLEGIGRESLPWN